MSILPTLRASKVIKALNKAGFVKIRQSGSHMQLRNPNNPMHCPTVPVHSRDLSRHILRSIIKQSGMSVKEFLKLL